MIRLGGCLAVAFLMGIATAVVSAQEPTLQTWCLDHGRLEASAGATDAPLAVGSLQKPFVVRAWAQGHPDTATPRFTCLGGSECWLKKGHGNLGLAAALARSCNAYFRQLAASTSPKELAESLAHARFAPAPTNPDEAIGLAAPGLLRIRPSQLLEAYRELLREPWPLGEPVRQEVLRGLRDSVRGGTAAGLNAWGFWAKTGTVPLDNMHTVGVALALDDADLAMLARLSPGTGAQAAKALAMTLAVPLAARWQGTPVPARTGDAVTVRLFELLPATGFTVRNTGATPIPDNRGFLGPGAARALHPGDRVGPGPLEFRCGARGLRRRLVGRVQMTGGHLLATLTRRAYVEGVLAAELPCGERDLRLQLGAAVLRFLARGPRHLDADVCDSTHCAWFVGQGPRLDWTNPAHAREEEVAPEFLSDGDWNRIEALAKLPGPFLWTAHCGGRSLSTQRVWGWGEAAGEPCRKHSGDPAAWTRTWHRQELEKAFGGGIESISLEPEMGVWGLTVVQHGLRRTYGYDEAHRRMAAVKGWDALPSPASRIEMAEDGMRLFGEGQGHRVGLCLGN
jgi:hypothetical protein